MTALPTFATEANALQVDVNNKQTLAATSQSNAATSETNAAASAAAAAASSNATIWVSGTTYAIGDTRFSPLDFRTYRSKSAHGGTTDPSADPTNWQLISMGPLPYLHVRDEKTSGTDGGASTATTYHTRTLNTVVGSNTITGASLASNTVTLPAGTYDFEARAPGGSFVTNHKLFLYNSTDSVNIIIGDTSFSDTTPAIAYCSGRFTISATKNIQLRHYITSAQARGLGTACSISGVSEVYATLQLWKVN